MSLIFVAYVRFIMEYACQVWSSSMADLINGVERVRCLCTERIHIITNLTFDERPARSG